MSTAKAEAPKKTVTVKAENGVTFAGKEYKKGGKIECTEAQEEILKAQGVI